MLREFCETKLDKTSCKLLNVGSGLFKHKKAAVASQHHLGSKELTTPRRSKRKYDEDHGLIGVGETSDSSRPLSPSLPVAKKKAQMLCRSEKRKNITQYAHEAVEARNNDHLQVTHLKKLA